MAGGRLTLLSVDRLGLQTDRPNWDALESKRGHYSYSSQDNRRRLGYMNLPHPGAPSTPSPGLAMEGRAQGATCSRSSEEVGCSGNHWTREGGREANEQRPLTGGQQQPGLPLSEGTASGPWKVPGDWSSPYLLMDVREMLAEAGML